MGSNKNPFKKNPPKEFTDIEKLSKDEANKKVEALRDAIEYHNYLYYIKNQPVIFDCLEAIRNGGFCMIEVCSFPAHLDYHDHDAVRETAERMKDLGMEPYSFHAPFSDDIDITALGSEQRDYSCQEILRASEAAAILEVRNFVIHPGPEKSFDKLSAEEYFQRLKNSGKVLNRVSQHCRELNFKGAFILELAGNTEKDASSMVADARQARRFLRDISRHLDLATPPTV